jgi:putative acetyltransferase
MTGSLELRWATNADGDGIADLIATVFGEYPGCVFDRAAEFPELDAIADHFAKDNGAIWVVVASEGSSVPVLGCLGITVDDDGKCAELHKVYLSSDLRGQGLAQRMLVQALDWLEMTSPDCDKIRLWSDSRFEAGHRFYEKCGFIRTGETRDLDDLSQSIDVGFVGNRTNVGLRLRR